MKKYIFITWLLLLVVLLPACSTAADNVLNSSTSEEDAITGDNWFNPTPPEEIQLASGQLQFFEFSAVW